MPVTPDLPGGWLRVKLATPSLFVVKYNE